MSTNTFSAARGRVASLHLHPGEPGNPLQSVEAIDVVEAKGILGEPRYFGRVSRTSGEPSRRQVTIMEREQIAEHATALGLEEIPPGAVRSNIETLDLSWLNWPATRSRLARLCCCSMRRATLARKWTQSARDFES